MIKRKKHILYEGKCWQKVISAVLTTLIFINSVPSMMQINADNGIPDGCYLGTITNEATNANTYETEDSGGDVEEVGKYSKKFYDEISNKYKSSYTSADTALEISTPGQLAAFAKFVNAGNNFSGKYVKLTDNIDLKGTAPTIEFSTPDTNNRCDVTISGSLSNVWVPIGTSDTNYFAGTFDGGGYEIRDMVVNQKLTSGNAYGGLFGSVQGGTIKNVSITGEQSTIIVSSSSYSCSGGIVGEAASSSSISNCTNTGNGFSSSSSSYSGGLVGYAASSSSISNCTNTGNGFSSSSSSYSGGIVGCAISISVSNCSNAGAVSSSSSSFSCSGGIVGCARASRVSNCSNSGAVSSSSSSSSSSFSRAYSGGIVGSVESATIECCYSAANKITATGSTWYKGGVFGYKDSPSIANNCYYDKNLAGEIGAVGAKTATGSDDTANNVKGLTTTEMQGENAKTNMEGFADQTVDEKKVWYFSAGNYPKLYTDTILSVNPPPHTTTGI